MREMEETAKGPVPPEESPSLCPRCGNTHLCNIGPRSLFNPHQCFMCDGSIDEEKGICTFCGAIIDPEKQSECERGEKMKEENVSSEFVKSTCACNEIAEPVLTNEFVVPDEEKGGYIHYASFVENCKLCGNVVHFFGDVDYDATEDDYRIARAPLGAK